jgi:hypothetical protein
VDRRLTSPVWTFGAGSRNGFSPAGTGAGASASGDGLRRMRDAGGAQSASICSACASASTGDTSGACTSANGSNAPPGRQLAISSDVTLGTSLMRGASTTTAGLGARGSAGTGGTADARMDTGPPANVDERAELGAGVPGVLARRPPPTLARRTSVLVTRMNGARAPPRSRRQLAISPSESDVRCALGGPPTPVLGPAVPLDSASPVRARRRRRIRNPRTIIASAATAATTAPAITGVPGVWTAEDWVLLQATSGRAALWRRASYRGTLVVIVVETTELEVLVNVVVNECPPETSIDVPVVVEKIVVEVGMVVVTAPADADMESACPAGCVGCNPTAILARLSASLHRPRINMGMPKKTKHRRTRR